VNEAQLRGDPRRAQRAVEVAVNRVDAVTQPLVLELSDGGLARLPVGEPPSVHLKQLRRVEFLNMAGVFEHAAGGGAVG